MAITWSHQMTLASRRYSCGGCGQSIASEKGWSGTEERRGIPVLTYICHNCGKPTFFGPDGSQWPGVPYGDDVQHVTDADLMQLYDEARRAYSAGSFTCVTLACRKILMHVAVAKGARPGESYASYVSYLVNNHYVPPGAEGWIGDIRETGNEANHDIILSTAPTAQRLLDFVAMLLKFIYEFPARVAPGKEVASESGS